MDGKADVTDAAANASLLEEKQVWQNDTLAHLRAFGRRWHMPVGPLASKLDIDVFSDDNAAPEIRAVLLSVLYL